MAIRQRDITLGILLFFSLTTLSDGLPFPNPEEIPHYEIALDVDFAGGTFSGVERIKFVNATGEKLDEVFFRLYPNASALYGDGLLSVEEVLVEGDVVETSTSMGETILMVALPSPLEDAETISLELRFNGRPAVWGSPGGTSSHVGYGIYAASGRTMTLASFYPILAVYDEEGWNIDPVYEIGDPVFSTIATYSVSVTTEPGLAILTSGRLMNQELNGERCSYQFAGEGMRDFIITLGEGYTQCIEHVGAVALRTSFFPEHAQAGQIAMTHAKAAITLYEQLFGPFAYNELDLVEVPLERTAGVEYPGLILIAEGYSDNPHDRFFDIIVSHEAAHQWFYAVVGNDVIEEPWLDEAFATFASLLFLEETCGVKVARTTIADWQASYRSTCARHPELSVTSPLYRFPDSATYNAFVYYGGALFLDEVRRTIGDTAFFAALSAYYHDLAFQVACAFDLLWHLEEACACDLSEVFSSYLNPQEKN